MGVRILEGRYDGSRAAAVLVDSVTGLAFGPLFDDTGEADSFLTWLRADARVLNGDELAVALAEFREERLELWAAEDAKAKAGCGCVEKKRCEDCQREWEQDR